eukprot:9485919-Alexandrium_andersonii.AAC.1
MDRLAFPAGFPDNVLPLARWISAPRSACRPCSSGHICCALLQKLGHRGSGLKKEARVVLGPHRLIHAGVLHLDHVAEVLRGRSRREAVE